MCNENYYLNKIKELEAKLAEKNKDTVKKVIDLVTGRFDFHSPCNICINWDMLKENLLTDILSELNLK